MERSDDRFDVFAGGEQQGEELMARGKQKGGDTLAGAEQRAADLLTRGERRGADTLAGGEQRGADALSGDHQTVRSTRNAVLRIRSSFARSPEIRRTEHRGEPR